MSQIMKRTKKDTAVSPVVGVMLMLVVTIIIAAVVASFAGGLVTTTEVAPNAVLDVNINDAVLVDSDSNIYAPDFTIDHLSGDSLNTADLKINVKWTNSTGITKTNSFSAASIGEDWANMTGISSYYSYGNASMYLNANPSAAFGDAILTNGGHLQTAGNYIYDYFTTPANTVMTANPFIDYVFSGEVTSTYAGGIWSGGVIEDIGTNPVQVTIIHIPSGQIIYDKEVYVE
jgi:FlaG/FlaF family flagellin (archaellin)